MLGQRNKYWHLDRGTNASKIEQCLQGKIHQNALYTKPSDNKIGLIYADGQMIISSMLMGIESASIFCMSILVKH